MALPLTSTFTFIEMFCHTLLKEQIGRDLKTDRLPLPSTVCLKVKFIRILLKRQILLREREIHLHTDQLARQAPGTSLVF